MKNELLLANAAQIVSLAGVPRPRLAAEMRELGIIPNGSMLVRDGKVAATGSYAEVRQQASAGCEELDATGRVILPGFVDAHTHTVFAGTRENEFEMRALGATYQEIAASGGGIRSTVRKTRAASEEELFATALARVRRFLEYGTTTIEAKSGYGLSVEDELKILRVIRRLNQETSLELVPTFLGAHEIPDEYRDNRAAYINLILDEMLPRVTTENLAEFCDVFCETQVFTVEESRRILTRAKELGLQVRFHADQLSLNGGSLLAAELHAISADHLEQIDDEGMAALKRAGVTALLLPASVFNLGLKRYPPARRMIDVGLRVALATDFNPGSSPTPSMQTVLSIACTQMKMTPAEAITAATINAAYSLNRGNRLGSLEIGKQADMVIYDCPDYRQIPYFFGINHAQTVIKKGQVVYSRGT